MMLVSDDAILVSLIKENSKLFILSVDIMDVIQLLLVDCCAIEFLINQSINQSINQPSIVRLVDVGGSWTYCVSQTTCLTV